jgi:transcriptional regulator with XRE-family HTH domain
VTMTFADWLKERREALGWSQDDLAAESGLKKPVISKLENSVAGYMPRFDTLVPLCTALHASLSDPLIATGLLDRADLSISPEEESLIQAHRALDDRGRKNLSDFAKTLLKNHATHRVRVTVVRATPLLTRNKKEAGVRKKRR